MRSRPLGSGDNFSDLMHGSPGYLVKVEVPGLTTDLPNQNLQGGGWACIPGTNFLGDCEVHSHCWSDITGKRSLGLEPRSGFGFGFCYTYGSPTPSECEPYK